MVHDTKYVCMSCGAVWDGLQIPCSHCESSNVAAVDELLCDAVSMFVRAGFVTKSCCEGGVEVGTEGYAVVSPYVVFSPLAKEKAIILVSSLDFHSSRTELEHLSDGTYEAGVFFSRNFLDDMETSRRGWELHAEIAEEAFAGWRKSVLDVARMLKVMADGNV